MTAVFFPGESEHHPLTAIVRPSGLYSTPQPLSTPVSLSRLISFPVVVSKISVSVKLFAATVRPSRLNETPRTRSPGAGSVWPRLPVAASQITAVPSSCAVTNHLPSGLNATSTTWVPASHTTGRYPILARFR